MAIRRQRVAARAASQVAQVTDAPASQRGWKSIGNPYDEAITKADHDAVVAAKGRPYTDYPLGHYTVGKPRPSAPNIGTNEVFGVDTGFHITPQTEENRP